MHVVAIVLDVPLYQVFSYTHDVLLPVGSRVLVSFGNRKMVGFVWESQTEITTTTELKPILMVYPDVLSPDVLDLVKFCSSYYHCPIGTTIFSVIPQSLRKDKTLILKKPIKEVPLRINPVGVKLNKQQSEVVNAISTAASGFTPHILYGVTGSGKTEVYLSLIEKIVLQKKQVLVLVPEINLTPQMLSRFATRFDNKNIIVLTSNTSLSKRYQGYLSASLGACYIVIGTRLSIFTPFKNLGLIIVDEEHDQSFKQNDTLRYQARDLAVWRAQRCQIPIVLGSATPSLETLYKYRDGNYHLHKLTARAITNAALPKIDLINLNTVKVVDGLSIQALEAISIRLDKQELSLVFINRRGYCPVIACYECGHVMSCVRCSTTLVYHSFNKTLKCHHCAYTIKIPSACPHCKSQYLQAIGDGTQKIEEVLAKHFPSAKIGRIDQDTTSSKQAWQDLYEKINNHELDILVGTQMLAKGHDFHNLTLVVGLNIDQGLHSYDFRASELLFTQLTQVSGRAGRGNKTGQVLLQTRYPEHELYQYLLTHDFSGFVNYLFRLRKTLGLPPYTHYALFRASGRKLELVLEYLQAVVKLMQKLAISDIFVYEAVPSIMQRLKNKERGQILIQSTKRQQIKQLFDRLLPLLQQMKPKHAISYSIDIDPYEM